ncbi:uncharacterized protein LOC126366455 [Pectinophora gossypiella]|uniref:uncharacterized protein LOC126366455 n=1 Tax=Pectinophora gossypiella TaxID=13191 RepID=UPI00214E2933|nr:uncharacterized protein LOC126366455 [Pectinophora gossypiella]
MAENDDNSVHFYACGVGIHPYDDAKLRHNFKRTVKGLPSHPVFFASSVFHAVHGPLRNKAKRMLNRIDFAPPRFSVYGMWHVDGLFMMQFLNVVSTVFVTLLQFALL